MKVKLTLVPVEVFAAGICRNYPACPHCAEHEGYGLSDATSAWSDCNRAVGHIYRVEDLAPHPAFPNPERETVDVWVEEEDLPFFQKCFSSEEG